MIRATISQVKNGLSAYLRKVKAGETVLIMDRKTPIACITPMGVDAAQDAKLARLERAGIVVRGGSGSPLTVLGAPMASSAAVLDALLQDRREGR